MEPIFTRIYENKVWGNNRVEGYSGSSGSGTVVNSAAYVAFLRKFIQDHSISSVVDLGCGDFLVGDSIYHDLDVAYTGYDAYASVVEYNTQKFRSTGKYNFIHMDFFTRKEEIIQGDLCILRDVIMHWDLRSIYTFLDYIVQSKRFKYILLCNCAGQTADNPEIVTGGWRPLSARFMPLKAFHPQIVYTYLSNTEKEISVIKIES